MPARDAVLFDLDSTLCVSEQSDHDIHEAVFERMDVEPFFSPADVRAVDGDDVAVAESKRGYYENLYRAVAADVGVDPDLAPDVESDREHYANLYGAAAEAAGADPDEALLDALAEATLEVYDSTLVGFREGAHEALQYASERYAVGLLTNGTEETQGTKLDRLGIGDAFDATVFCGAGTDYPPKPAPEPFGAVLDRLGVSPANAVYVGDRLDGDVAGAHDAGMDSAWVPTGDPPTDPDPEPTYLLDSPAALSTVL